MCGLCDINIFKFVETLFLPNMSSSFSGIPYVFENMCSALVESGRQHISIGIILFHTFL